MSTPDVKVPGIGPKELSGVTGLSADLQTGVPTTRVAAAKTPTGINNFNVHSPEGRAAVQQTLLDLGLTMPEFIGGADNKIIANLGKDGMLQLQNLGTAAGALTAPGADSPPTATADLQGRWADFIAQQNVGNAMDVNALVEYVLREAYMENTKDLQFYAQKVRFYNNLKKLIRDELTKAREYLSEQAGKQPEDALTGTYANSTGTAGALSFPTEPDFDAGTGQMVPHDPVQDDTIPFATKDNLDTYIQNLEEKLNSVGDDAQLANVDLQNMLQKQQQTLQMMSNISKMLHDTALAIIRKIGS